MPHRQYVEQTLWTGDFEEDLDRIEAILAQPGWCAIDLETTVARATEREVCTIQVTHQNGEEAFAYVYPRGRYALQRVLRDPEASLVAFNAQFEAECFVHAGVEVYPECAMVAAKVLTGTMQGDKTKRVGWSLKELVKRFFDKERDKTVREEDWRNRPTTEMVEYGMEDTRDALDLWFLWLDKFDDDSWDGYRTIMDALPAAIEVNLRGLPYNKSGHAKLIETLKAEKADWEFDMDCLVSTTGYGEINHGSTQQVAGWMMWLMMSANFNEAQAKDPTIFSMAYQNATGQHWPTTKTGHLSLDRKAVESRLATLSKVAPTVADYLLTRLQWSKVTKLLQAFGPALAQFEEADGYIRGTLKMHGAQTSRTSCVAPNLQQMPAEPEFRALFKAKPGRKLVIADYGQIELRVGCIIAGDTAMQLIFEQGLDIHSATFENVQRALGRQVTYDPDNPAHRKGRKAGKAVTFASLYGALAPTIAANSGISLAEAEELLEAWLDAYPGIRGYRNSAFEKAKAEGGVKLVSGQTIRMAHDTRPSQAINAPVQGSSASVLYRAMYRTHRGVKSARVLSGADMWLAASVHDELIIDAAEEDAEMAKDILEKEMTAALLDMYPQAAKLGLTNLTDAAVVDSWAEKP